MNKKYINPALIFAIGWMMIFFAYSSVLAKDETPAKKSDSQTILYKPPMRACLRIVWEEGHAD